MKTHIRGRLPYETMCAHTEGATNQLKRLAWLVTLCFPINISGVIQLSTEVGVSCPVAMSTTDFMHVRAVGAKPWLRISGAQALCQPHLARASPLTVSLAMHCGSQASYTFFMVLVTA